MTLQSSGAISLGDLRTEFGVSGSISFFDCYAGTEGAVPPAFGGFNNNIPVSGSGTSIALDDFYGAQNIFEVTITSVGRTEDKLSNSQGYNSVTGMGDVPDNYLPNFRSNLLGSSTSNFISTNITFQMELVDDEFGNNKMEAFTTVTWFAPTTTVRLSKTQLSATVNTSSAVYVYEISPSATGVFWPHTPEGGKVRIRFENNG